MSHLLFVYGTLLLPGNEYHEHLKNRAAFLTTAKIMGALYDIGEYPGLVLNEGSAYWVYGSMYNISEDALTIIDEYEGYSARNEQDDLFIRAVKPITTINGQVDAWVYLYNLSITGFKKIKPGDYVNYIKTKNLPGL